MKLFNSVLVELMSSFVSKLFYFLLQDVQRYIVMRYNMFGAGSGFNFQQLVDHYFHVLKQWNNYKRSNSISAERLGGSSAYEVLLRAWLDESDDKIFTSFQFFREVRTFVNEDSFFYLCCRTHNCYVLFLCSGSQCYN